MPRGSPPFAENISRVLDPAIFRHGSFRFPERRHARWASLFTRFTTIVEVWELNVSLQRVCKLFTLPRTSTQLNP